MVLPRSFTAFHSPTIRITISVDIPVAAPLLRCKALKPVNGSEAIDDIHKRPDDGRELCVCFTGMVLCEELLRQLFRFPIPVDDQLFRFTELEVCLLLRFHMDKGFVATVSDPFRSCCVQKLVHPTMPSRSNLQPSLYLRPLEPWAAENNLWVLRMVLRLGV